MALTNLGVTYMCLHRFTESKEKFMKAWTLARERKEEFGEIVTLQRLQNLATKLGT